MQLSSAGRLVLRTHLTITETGNVCKAQLLQVSHPLCLGEPRLGRLCLRPPAAVSTQDPLSQLPGSASLCLFTFKIYVAPTVCRAHPWHQPGPPQTMNQSEAAFYFQGHPVWSRLEEEAERAVGPITRGFNGREEQEGFLEEVVLRLRFKRCIAITS